MGHHIPCTSKGEVKEPLLLVFTASVFSFTWELSMSDNSGPILSVVHCCYFWLGQIAFSQSCLVVRVCMWSFMAVNKSILCILIRH